MQLTSQIAGLVIGLCGALLVAAHASGDRWYRQGHGDLKPGWVQPGYAGAVAIVIGALLLSLNLP